MPSVTREHVDGAAVVGVLKGTTLTNVPAFASAAKSRDDFGVLTARLNRVLKKPDRNAYAAG